MDGVKPTPVDRKRLRELFDAPGPHLVESEHVAGGLCCEPTLRAVLVRYYSEDMNLKLAEKLAQTYIDALEAAEQPALPMGDARDAARYRWLRGRNCAGSNRLPHITQYPYCPEIDAVKYPQVWEGSKYLPENLDAAIDAAIAEQAKERAP